TGRTWLAPAKLNLFLRITGRRPDGLHSLQTVFQLIDLCDELTLCVREDGKIHGQHTLDTVAPKNDLCLRAAQLLKEETGCPLGVNIHLKKRIPMGGGLGGGSSDAATVLLALNHLWDLHLDSDLLQALGLRLGADVPVFAYGHTAWAEGVGEQLRRIDLPQTWYLVIHPNAHVETKRVFHDPRLTRDSQKITMQRFLDGTVGNNDCEAVVRRLYPSVAEALDWLGQRADASLTGTGSCVFSSFAAPDLARKILADLPKAWQGFLCRGLGRSPMLDLS
ncbi:MAG: 4-(cytidine 5'-diphospho)-2-C-methyl-D-erythritol kinase, partial [Candidatus Eutrophobiaceae bacterium]